MVKAGQGKCQGVGMGIIPTHQCVRSFDIYVGQRHDWGYEISVRCLGYRLLSAHDFIILGSTIWANRPGRKYDVSFSAGTSCLPDECCIPGDDLFTTDGGRHAAR